MVHESMRNLKLDRRLARRRGWVEPGELEGALEALPDASEKFDRVAFGEVAVPEAGEPEAAPGAGEPEEPGV